MLESITCIDVDISTGKAYVGISDGLGNAQILRIDAANRSVENIALLDDLGSPRALFVQQGEIGLLNFSINGCYLPEKSEQDIAFTIAGAASDAIFDMDRFDKRSSGLQQSDSLPMPESYRDINGVLVWAQDQSGLSAIKRGSIGGLAQESFQTPQQIIRLPKFTWSISGADVGLSVIVGDSLGNVSSYAIDSSAHDATLEPVGMLSSVQSPLYGSSISGVVVHPHRRDVVVSSDKQLVFLDPNTLGISDNVMLDVEISNPSYDTNYVLWLNVSGEGKIMGLDTTGMSSSSSSD
jgi:hypothetical protein